MRNLLYIILFSSCLFTHLEGQDIHTVKKFSDELFSKGNYQAALKEYQRVLFFDKQNEYTELYSRIATIHYNLSDFDNAIRYLDLAQHIENNDSIKFELTLKKALCNFKLDKYFEALNELYDLPDHPSPYLQNKKNLYLGICHFGLDDYGNSLDCFSGLFNSEGAEKIHGLFSDFEDYNRKFRPGKVELMSMLMPGLGQVYAGEVFNGVNSFFLVSGVTCYAIITALNYGIIDGLLVMSSWFYRYYSGGFTNARNFAVQKIEDEKIRLYAEIFSLIEDYQNNMVK
ncbi:MAG TPA: tetratricopeptide repeat protein [Bacteroidetes bacterium]|nr:tetratricopeptide repeat protein [Bacteroidota bacterium]